MDNQIGPMLTGQEINTMLTALGTNSWHDKEWISVMKKHSWALASRVNRDGTIEKKHLDLLKTSLQRAGDDLLRIKIGIKLLTQIVNHGDTIQQQIATKDFAALHDVLNDLHVPGSAKKLYQERHVTFIVEEEESSDEQRTEPGLDRS